MKMQYIFSTHVWISLRARSFFYAVAIGFIIVMLFLWLFFLLVFLLLHYSYTGLDARSLPNTHHFGINNLTHPLHNSFADTFLFPFLFLPKLPLFFSFLNFNHRCYPAVWVIWNHLAGLLLHYSHVCLKHNTSYFLSMIKCSCWFVLRCIVILNQYGIKVYHIQK